MKFPKSLTRQNIFLDAHKKFKCRKMVFPTLLKDWFGGKFYDHARDMLIGGWSNERNRCKTPELRKILAGKEH